MQDVLHPILIHAGCTSSTSKRCEITCIAPSANNIVIHSTCWNNWNDYNGRLEGYIYSSGGCHKGICIRQIDSKIVARFDLFIENKVWKVKVKSSKWEPKKQTIFKTSGNWHLALILLSVVRFGTTFGKWKLCNNNCHKWSKGFFAVLFVSEDKYKTLKSSCPGPILNEFKLQSIIEKFGWKFNLKPDDEPDEIEPDCHRHISQPL